jgi:hypothetical protein
MDKKIQFFITAFPRPDFVGPSVGLLRLEPDRFAIRVWHLRHLH